MDQQRARGADSPGTRSRRLPLEEQPVLELSDVSYLDIVHGVSTRLDGGQLIGLLGPNGAGKSTLLRLATGVLTPTAGCVQIGEQDMRSFNPRDRARQIAYLPQQLPDDIPFTVREFVEMGRYAHRAVDRVPSASAWRTSAVRQQQADTSSTRQRPSGRAVVDSALQRMSLTNWADAPMRTLSGGERQRAGIARCLAQESRVLLLDEPIASLDLYYQVDILQQLRKLAEEGYLVVVAIHHLELAIRFCSRFLLLHCGRMVRHGDVSEVMTEEALAEVFRIQARTYRDPFTGTLRLSVVDTDSNGA